jgi:hypothetical protein
VSKKKKDIKLTCSIHVAVIPRPGRATVETGTKARLQSISANPTRHCSDQEPLSGSPLAAKYSCHWLKKTI